MKISESMVRYYLHDITMGWFDPEDLPPDNITGYYDCVIQMKLHALKHNDLDVLKLAFEYLLANKQIKCEQFAGGRYPYDEQEVREIIHYAWKTIWPDSTPLLPGGPNGVEIVPMSIDDWWAS